MKRARNAMVATVAVVGLSTAAAVGLAIVRADGEGGGHSHGPGGHGDEDMLVEETGHAHEPALDPGSPSARIDTPSAEEGAEGASPRTLAGQPEPEPPAVGPEPVAPNTASTREPHGHGGAPTDSVGRPHPHSGSGEDHPH